MLDNNSKISPEIAIICSALENQFSWYRKTFSTFDDLYVDKAKTVDTLNDIAPDFFGFLQYTLINSLIVILSRLTDPEATGSHENLSFSKLLSLVDKTKYPELHEKISENLSQLIKCSKSARLHRNKRVAHVDLHTSLSTTAPPDVLITDFREALKAGTKLLNSIPEYFENLEVSERIAPPLGGTPFLIQALEKARELKNNDLLKYHSNA